MARQRRRKWAKWLVALGFVLLLALGVIWWKSLPRSVHVVLPQARTVTETVVASGEVAGQRETALGAQVQGVVTDLLVRDGAQVQTGQVLARIRSEVAQAQVAQAMQALQTARAQLEQARAGALPSELRAAESRVTQAQATVAQRKAELDRARATLQQAEARRDLAGKDVQRYRYLLSQRAVARQRVEQAATEYRVAQADVTAAREGVETAQATIRAAQAIQSGAEADLRTLRAGPRSEAVEVARRRVREVEGALRTAQEQAANYVIRAPFSGTITHVVAEVGTSIGPGGVLRLVETTRPEIDVDVDETNLAALRVGQRAAVTSSTFRGDRFDATVTKISPSVDPTRGTVEVTLVPQRPPVWLRPGQTVDVEIITEPTVERLTLPRGAIRRIGGRSVVLIVRDGRAVAQPVIIGEVSGDMVPVMEGVAATDQVILDATKTEPGTRVRVTGGSVR